MAALTHTFLSILRSGRHIIMTDDSYRRTRQFCEDHMKRFNIGCTVVPLGDYDALEAAIRPETRILFSETPSNPFLRVLDVERFAEIGRRRGVLTVIDATLATLAHEFDRLDGRPQPDAIVAIGGTATNLAAVKHHLAHFDPDRVQRAATLVGA